MKLEGTPCISESKTHKQGRVEDFVWVLESFPGLSNVNASKSWEHFGDTVYNAAMFVFGKKTERESRLIQGIEPQDEGCQHCHTVQKQG